MKILAFAPHADIWAHSFPEALVLDALQRHGHTIVYITCGGVLSEYCIVMSSRSLPLDRGPAEKNRVCRSCCGTKALLRSRFKFAGYDVEDVLQTCDIERVEAALAQVSASNFHDFVFNGIPIGRIAAYEVLLTFKKSSAAFSSDEFLLYRAYLRNTLISYFAAERIIESERPDRVITYNAIYSVNHVWQRVAAARGVLFFNLHAGPCLWRRLDRMLISRGNNANAQSHIRRQWNDYKKMPCSAAAARAVTNHFLELIAGRHFLVYSSPFEGAALDIRTRFRIPAESKILLATMSSYDEVFAAEFAGVRQFEPGAFSDQVEWIEKLVAYAEMRRDSFLIVRVHPREFPNKREGVKSEHARRLERCLALLPPNVAVNWPDDQVSLYSLAQVVDAVFNAWSSVGEEMSLLGIPVVTHTPEALFYPSELTYSAATETEYFQCAERALTDGWNAERIRMAYRWHALKFHYATVDLAPERPPWRSASTRLWAHIRALGYKTLGRLTQSALERLAYAERRDEALTRLEPVAEAALANDIVVHGAATPVDARRFSACISEHQEMAVIRGELKRICEAMYGPDWREDPNRPLKGRLIAFANN